MRERNKLFVGGFPLGTTRTDLVRLFSRAGAVFGVKLVVDRVSGESKGIAYVEMATPDDARVALKKLDGAELGGKRIFVVPSRKKGEKPAAAAPAAPKYGPGPGQIERRSGKDRRRPSAPPSRTGSSDPRRRSS